jgi:hypothetical protein
MLRNGGTMSDQDDEREAGAMGNNHTASMQRGPGIRCVLALVVLSMTAAAGCTAHRVAQQNPCTAVSIRGAVAVAKLGLTHKELKLQQKC